MSPEFLAVARPELADAGRYTGAWKSVKDVSIESTLLTWDPQLSITILSTNNSLKGWLHHLPLI